MNISKETPDSDNQTLVNFDELNTSSRVAEYLRLQGRNIIPIVPGTKIPPKGFELALYFDKICDYPIRDSDSIAMLHGKVSNTYAIDIDMKNGEDWKKAVHIVAKDIEKILAITMVVKTPKQGCHLIVEPIGQLPPKNAKYFNIKGVEIDIKTQGGYTLLPPSIHPDKHLGKYQFVSSTLKTNPTSWPDFEAHLASIGFFLKEDIENKDLQNDYDLDKLLHGKFERGTRRKSLNSLYCKMRVRRWSIKQCIKKIKEINGELAEPLDDKEIENNLKSSESFFSQIVQPSLDDYSSEKKELGEFSGSDKIDNVAAKLQKEYSFITLRKTEEILLYNGKIYDNLQAETIIKEETENLIPNCTTHNRLEVINKIKAQTFSELEKFDTDPNLITVENGILNLTTLELTPHTPDHLSRVLLPVEYHKPEYDNIEQNLKDTLFWKFLINSFTIDGKLNKESFECALEIAASPIIKRHIDEKAIMNLGGGENGKSVFLSYIHSIIGKNNVSNIALQDLAEDKFMRANLVGKSANIFPDLEPNELRHTGKVKAITSNEGIEVQKKHQQAFTLHPFAKLIFSCNRFPKVFDQSQGFFRRWLILKWERDFENDPARIEYLKEKLDENQEEKNLVFSCLVKIANRLNQTGKFTYSKDWKEIRKEWNENADPIDDFATNYIIESEGNKTKRDTYHFYKESMIEKGETPKGIGQFSKAFSEYYDEDRVKGDGRTERVWLNIDFKEPIQSTLNEHMS